ncbi:hypothetical protein B0H11DRAFT_2259965 [Mycena galericulata]|nr:hypothetical protein B0H11DRAFT_2259965 [Mycena galericulata]
MTITRRQARLAAELAAAAQAVAVVEPAAPPSPSAAAATSNSLHTGSTFGSFSSLSTLTPTSSFVSEAGTVVQNGVVQNGGGLASIAETDVEDEFDDEDFATRHGDRPLITPAHSQSNRFPAEVFETPKKNLRLPPTRRDLLAARWMRDSELVASKGMAQLTRTGTLLVPQDSSPESIPRAGSDLGSPFTSPSSSVAAPNTRDTRIPREETRVINPDTGEFVEKYTMLDA